MSAKLSMPEITHRCWSVAGKELCRRQYSNIFRLLLARYSLKLISQRLIDVIFVKYTHTQRQNNKERKGKITKITMERANETGFFGLKTMQRWQISFFLFRVLNPLELVGKKSVEHANHIENAMINKRKLYNSTKIRRQLTQKKNE